MRYARHTDRRDEVCEIVDFDEAFLDACAPEERVDLMAEARRLAQAFAAEAGPEALEAMARDLSTGARDEEMERAHARKLAAAMRRLAKDPWGDPD